MAHGQQHHPSYWNNNNNNGGIALAMRIVAAAADVVDWLIHVRAMAMHNGSPRRPPGAVPIKGGWPTQ